MKHFLYILLLVSTILFTACDKCNIDYDFTDNNALTFRILDKTSKQLIIWPSGFTDPDQAIVYDDSGKTLSTVEGSNGSTIYFLVFDDRAIPNNTQVTRQIYIPITPTDTDTITIEFIKKLNDCEYDAIDNVKISYQDSVYSLTCCRFDVDLYK